MYKINLFIDCTQTVDCFTEFIDNFKNQSILVKQSDLIITFVCNSPAECSFVNEICDATFSKELKIQIIDAHANYTGNSGWIHVAALSKLAEAEYIYFLTGNCFFEQTDTIEAMLKHLDESELPVATISNIFLLNSHDHLTDLKQLQRQNFLQYETFFSSTLVKTAWFREAFKQYFSNKDLSISQRFDIGERFQTAFEHMKNFGNNILFDSAHSCIILNTYKIGWWHKLNIFSYYTYYFDEKVKNLIQRKIIGPVTLLEYIDIVYRRIISGKIDIIQIDSYILKHKEEILQLLLTDDNCIACADNVTMWTIGLEK